MKKILGLDLGTTSIGWALVNEAEKESEKSKIIKLGVRVIPLSTDEEIDFQKGKAVTINADRTLKRGARRNLDRYQLRRDSLIEILKSNKLITKSTILSEEGKSTFETYKIRSKAATGAITLEEFAKVLLMINKKRGYKSSRKAKSDDEGVVIDGMEVAKILSDEKLTPGEYVYNLLLNNKKNIPEFYRSDLQNEFDNIWNKQKEYYSEILINGLKDELINKNKTQTWAICKEPFNIVGIKRETKGAEQKKENYKWRMEGLKTQLSLEQLAIVLQEINNQTNQSSGYLGAISDRSKELYFNSETVGEFLYSQLLQNPHSRLKNQVFYRQDYLDEFEVIWETQAKYHSELTKELKIEIRDVVIFYQRRLKSQKHLISNCEFEKYHKTIPKSSPLFQEYKIWQIINNLEIRHKPSRTTFKNEQIDQETKAFLFTELNIVNKLSASEVLKILVEKPKEYELNFKDGLEGNRTNAALYKAYYEILKQENIIIDFKKLSAEKINKAIEKEFAEININKDILSLNTNLEGNEYDKQPLIQLWHLLYSFEGDNSRTGDENLIKAISEKFGFKLEHAKIISKVDFQADYGSLSAKAIRKIIPYLKEGSTYDKACALARYNHSSSLTKEQLESRDLNKIMDLLPKNSLRNPVVEKILNQLVNVVNAIIKDETLGKPDEIRIELARDLKQSAKERADATTSISKATKIHDDIKLKIAKLYPFNTGVRITRNDIIKYKLYQELAPLGYKTIYTNTFVPLEKLFSKEFDIEHILPKALLFDDSFSNKTLATRDFNSREKSNKTGIDAIIEKYGEDSADYHRYISNIEKLYNKGKSDFKKAKYNKLLMSGTELPTDFIERDLRNSQYIAKKAKQMLECVVRTVNTSTGRITSRLRDDWQLINVMQELNWDKYDKLGLTHYEKSKDGRDIPKIKDWTKRNDHRHHAMDALTVAFTRYEHVQYLNNMSARKNESHEKYHSVYGIEQKHLYRNEKGKLLFKSPIPVKEFRFEAEKHLNSILISFKAKNKVVTRNKNKIKISGKGNYITKNELTPRGQLHKETIYGKIEQYQTKEVKVGIAFDLEMIKKVANQKEREALLMRLVEFEGNSKKAFTGKNSPSKNPIFIDETKTNKIPEKVKIVWKEPQYTIRKVIGPDIKIDKVIDVGIKRILQIRLSEFGNDPKKAFVNLDEQPIWLNKDKGICIKRVTITGVNNVEALHSKKDHNGEHILDKNGNKQAVDFVSTGNNHHVAIYRDIKGKLHEEVVSFYEAVSRVNAGLHIIDKEKDGLEFLFTMKQNEYFIFPSDNFNPEEIDLLNPENANLISPNLYRVQKIANGDYNFRHHLETTVDNIAKLKNISFKRIGLNGLTGVIKVRINHLGQIVKVGE